MRTRIKQMPELQANSANYGARTILTHEPVARKERGYGSRALELRADKAMNELNNLFEIN